MNCEILEGVESRFINSRLSGVVPVRQQRTTVFEALISFDNICGT